MLRIGTRGSALALFQANLVASRLRAIGVDSELVAIRTTGDRRTDVSLAAIGGKGLFIKEIEQALEQHQIDIAVHSLKDVPSEMPEPFELAAYIDREDARDVWIDPEGRSLFDLDRGARIGTSAPRRRTQLLAMRRDLEIEEMRGNVDTRIRKALDHEYDGIVLAAAGVKRLGRSDVVTSYFTLDEMVPAAGQGVIVVEALREQREMIRLVKRIEDTEAALTAQCERGVLEAFGDQLDCHSPIAAHATVQGSDLILRAFVSDISATTMIRLVRSAPRAEWKRLAASVAAELETLGARRLLAPG